MPRVIPSGDEGSKIAQIAMQAAQGNEALARMYMQLMMRREDRLERRADRMEDRDIRERHRREDRSNQLSDYDAAEQRQIAADKRRFGQQDKRDADRNAPSDEDTDYYGRGAGSGSVQPPAPPVKTIPGAVAPPPANDKFSSIPPQVLAAYAQTMANHTDFSAQARRPVQQPRGTASSGRIAKNDPNLASYRPMAPELLASWAQSEKQFGLPAGTLMSIFGTDTDGGYKAGERGPFQIADVVRREYNISDEQARDPAISGQLVARYLRRGAQQLEQVQNEQKQPVTKLTDAQQDMWKYYMLYKFGPADGSRLLAAHAVNPKDSAAKALGGDAGFTALERLYINGNSNLEQVVEGRIREFNPWQNATINNRINKIRDRTSAAPDDTGGGGGDYVPRGGENPRGRAAVASWMDFAMRPREDGGLGLQRFQAAGLVGNLITESKLKTTAYNKSEGAYGAGQWRFDRLSGLRRLADKMGLSPSSVEVQQQWLRHEMMTTHNDAYKRLLRSRSSDEAADVVDAHYERSARLHGNTRRQWARRLDGSGIGDGSTARQRPQEQPPVQTAQPAPAPASTRVERPIIADAASVYRSIPADKTPKPLGGMSPTGEYQTARVKPPTAVAAPAPQPAPAPSPDIKPFNPQLRPQVPAPTVAAPQPQPKPAPAPQPKPEDPAIATVRKQLNRTVGDLAREQYGAIAAGMLPTDIANMKLRDARNHPQMGAQIRAEMAKRGVTEAQVAAALKPPPVAPRPQVAAPVVPPAPKPQIAAAPAPVPLAPLPPPIPVAPIKPEPSPTTPPVAQPAPLAPLPKQPDIQPTDEEMAAIDPRTVTPPPDATAIAAAPAQRDPSTAAAMDKPPLDIAVAPHQEQAQPDAPVMPEWEPKQIEETYPTPEPPFEPVPAPDVPLPQRRPTGPRYPVLEMIQAVPEAGRLAWEDIQDAGGAVGGAIADVYRKNINPAAREDLARVADYLNNVGKRQTPEEYEVARASRVGQGQDLMKEAARILNAATRRPTVQEQSHGRAVPKSAMQPSVVDKLMNVEPVDNGSFDRALQTILNWFGKKKEAEQAPPQKPQDTGPKTVKTQRVLPSGEPVIQQGVKVDVSPPPPRGGGAQSPPIIIDPKTGKAIGGTAPSIVPNTTVLPNGQPVLTIPNGGMLFKLPPMPQPDGVDIPVEE